MKILLLLKLLLLLSHLISLKYIISNNNNTIKVNKYFSEQN